MDNAERGIREAAARGAQIVCLQELFDAPYFCKVTDAERFDLAEPIPGPITVRMQALARELGVVIIVPIFEKRGPGVYHNSAGVIDTDGVLLGVYVNPWFLAFTGFVGLNLFQSAFTNWCPMMAILRRWGLAG